LKWYFYDVFKELDEFDLVPHINSITCMNYDSYRAVLSNIELTMDFPQIKTIRVRTLMHIFMCPNGFFLGGRGSHPRLRIVQRIEPGEQEADEGHNQEIAGQHALGTGQDEALLAGERIAGDGHDMAG